MKSVKKSLHSRRLYIGLDMGGTKIQAALVDESGLILHNEKTPTPRAGDPEPIIATIEKTIQDLMEKGHITRGGLAAIGIGVPGVVDPSRGFVAITPNACLSGVSLGPRLEKRFKTPVALGNDANFGALGEAWLGSARKSKSSLYICVGTGIGGGLVLRGRLWRGCRESAGEIGHMIMQIDGPKCGCGNRGCLEALASRTAMEREMREAIAVGRKTILADLAGADTGVFRSGIIRKALDANDELVSQIVGRAAEVLGYACLSLCHLVDTQVIVLGGGVIEACARYIMPVIEAIVGQDPLIGAKAGGKILLSALGDDAVVIGAVAAARRLVRRNPFKKYYRVKPIYPRIAEAGESDVAVDDRIFKGDLYVTVNGKTKRLENAPPQDAAISPPLINLGDLETICRGGPEILFIAAAGRGQADLADDARRFLELRSIKLKILPNRRAFENYNKSKSRRAILIRGTC